MEMSGEDLPVTKIKDIGAIEEPQNKKVKNTRKIIIDGIEFRSTLEGRCYEKLRDAGFDPLYEGEKILLFDGFKPNDQFIIWIPVYKNKKIIGFDRSNNKIQSITYTPDFVFEHNNHKIIIEVKGNPNDAYPNKRKLFFKVMNEISIIDNKKIIFFEPHRLSHMDQIIEIIKSL